MTSDQPLKSWYYFGFIFVDYQTGLCEKYLVTGDWSQSRINPFLILSIITINFSQFLLIRKNTFHGKPSVDIKKKKEPSWSQLFKIKQTC